MKVEAGELFRYRFLTEIRFGVGIRKKMISYLEELNKKKIVLIIDQNVTKTEPVKEMLTDIKQCAELLELEGPKGEPEILVLEDLRKKAKAFDPDLIIGIGGGSTLDTAKGLAAVLPNLKPAADYQGFDKLECPALPSILVPTLFGAGTEVTSSAVMINRERGMKGGINGRFVFPYMAVIDPELGLGAPIHIMGATALDALVHCIEGYVAKCATPLSRFFSKEAARIILPALFKLSENVNSVKALEDIAHASLMAVMGLMHSESGVCGAISYPLGVHYHVPHGLAGGLIMPQAITYNIEGGCKLYADLIEGEHNGFSSAQKLADNIRELITLFKLPRLSKFGVGDNNIDKLAEEIFSFKAILDMNPIKIETSDVIANLINSAV